MLWWEALLLVGGGFTAGVINTMAGGGSMLTVPLLVLAGVPGNDANGSNRVGILTSNAAAVASFRRLGIGEAPAVYTPILVPVVVGSSIGSFAISRLTDDTFETAFGLLMLPLIVLSIRKPRPRVDGSSWSAATTALVFFGIGLYGGAVQAGVGLVLLAALTRAGFDLVTANSVKVLVNVVVTTIALPIFVLQGHVRWLPAVILATGFTAGGYAGARFAVRGGDRWIRALTLLAAFALALRLIGVF